MTEVWCGSKSYPFRFKLVWKLYDRGVVGSNPPLFNCKLVWKLYDRVVVGFEPSPFSLTFWGEGAAGVPHSE